jgi:hypothetical protein
MNKTDVPSCKPICFSLAKEEKSANKLGLCERMAKGESEAGTRYFAFL